MTRRSSPLRVAVQLAPEHVEYADLRHGVARLEELGVDIALTWDHFFPLRGDPAGTHFECWSILAAWAEQTESIEIGALVSSNTYRNPDLLADIARTVDHISAKGAEGRLILGIGAGWNERDHAEYGFEFGTVGSRLDALADALPRIERRWEALNPRPTRRIPVLIGGEGERKTLRIVARHASIWHTFATPDRLAAKLEVLAAHCAAVGRDPRDIELSVATTESELRAGTLDELDEKRRLGASLVTLELHGPRFDYGVVADLVAWRDEASRRASA